MADQSPAPLLTARETAVLTGASERQLQYWHGKRLTKTRKGIHGGHVSIIYDGIELRRVFLLLRVTKLSSLRTGRLAGGRWLWPTKKVNESALAMRFLLFSPELKLVAATDDRADVIRIATKARGGVLLVELPAFERARAAYA